MKHPTTEVQIPYDPAHDVSHGMRLDVKRLSFTERRAFNRILEGMMKAGTRVPREDGSPGLPVVDRTGCFKALLHMIAERGDASTPPTARDRNGHDVSTSGDD